ncbi:hypothetical protein pah_c022o153 [Parachlamydia acanthamoebae str. Hall's coccus]|nr:hypothetical protein pah_c022o153 [Parachlamydia acanthamoebae str. Hall's coccus]
MDKSTHYLLANDFFSKFNIQAFCSQNSIKFSIKVLLS